MAGKCREYALLPEVPHMPREVVAQRLATKSHDDPSGCRLWLGYRHRTGRPTPILSVPTPSGRRRALFAHKLAWYVAHGVYPELPQELWWQCRNSMCINPDHLTMRQQQQRRVLTDEQVAQARKLYWAPRARLTDYQLGLLNAPTAEQLAAYALGLTPYAVHAIIDGTRRFPRKWEDYAQSPEHVRLAVELFRPVAEREKNDRKDLIGVEPLAQRFQVSMSCMYRLLHGTNYDHVPMPQEARTSYRRRLSASISGEVDAMKAQVRDELDRRYRQAQPLAELPVVMKID